jgi:hypothetical protein
MLPFDAERVEKNAREATTQDLLDRMTVFRDGMEPEALRIIEAELRHRGVSAGEIHDHGQRLRQDAATDASGLAMQCSFCRAPAVTKRWGWHKLWGKLPLFPRPIRYCKEHYPGKRVDN